MIILCVLLAVSKEPLGEKSGSKRKLTFKAVELEVLAEEMKNRNSQ